MSFANDVHQIAVALQELVVPMQSIAASAKRIADEIAPPAVGFEVFHGPQTIHPVSPVTKGTQMKMFKASAVKAKMMAKPPLKTAPPEFGLRDNEDDSVTLVGVDASGNPATLDTSLGTLATVSGDTSIVTVDPPVGLTYQMHAVGKLSVVGTPVPVTSTFTFAAGNPTPISVIDPINVIAGAANSFDITHGTPTSH